MSCKLYPYKFVIDEDYYLEGHAGKVVLFLKEEII
jgi:hypothetical protein